MIRIVENFDLTTYNTFNIAAKAKRFFEFTESNEFMLFLQREEVPSKYLVLGGGSNLLFTSDFDGLVIYPNIPGVVEENEDRNFVYLEAGAGVEWDEFVNLSVQYDLGGLENLSLIPGKVGAAPVQNIGAYGVEVKDRIHRVCGVEIATGNKVEFTNEQCEFNYRDSIFKNQLKDKIIITSVVFKLDKFHDYKLEYGALKSEVEQLGETNIQNIRKAVIAIRESKLPNPELIGNAGSFFKNPMVPAELARKISVEYPKMPQYSCNDEAMVKLAAGWLIEQCGWKGFKNKNSGVHENQALVLVNYGNATGAEIVSLATEIIADVKAKFGIVLEPEVNFI